MILSKSPTKGIFPELRGSLGAIRYPAFAEYKYDGEATLVQYDIQWPKKIVTCNKYGTMRSDWSKLDEIAEIMEDHDIQKALFLGELFFGEGKKGDLYKLLSHKQDDEALNIKIYDVAHIINDVEMKAGETALIDRKEILSELFTTHLIQPIVIQNKKEAMEVFETAKKAGYEGIVIKNFDGKLLNGPCSWVKMKDKDQNNYQIALIDRLKERIEILVPIPSITPGTSSPSFIHVGCKCANKYKKYLKVGDWVTIEHQGVLDSGSLRHPVFISNGRI
jgi:hypothetical protein